MRRVLVALAGFGLLLVASAWSYPGGHYTVREARGFSLWDNFWCDLLAPTSLAGAPNVLGSLLARAAFACFALALHLFWPIAFAFVGAGRRGVRIGQLGAAALLAVAAVPSSSSELVHGVAVVGCAGASTCAVVMLITPLFRAGERTSAWLALTSVGLTLVCLGQYVRQGLGGPWADWLAAGQKLTTVSLLALMVHVLARAQRAPP
jgi:hypothetical protein